ncbi:MAG: nucleotide pyrophosphohydrolase, partial [Sedimenticola sp.]|nr:nucleotide pyrophosphohydrolase [Sedimenticola sp.]
MSDQTVDSLDKLNQRLLSFARERDWEQFHSPKNLAMALIAECAELVEHFQWLTEQQSKQLDADALHNIGEELADIVIYSLSMANYLQLDLSETV